MLQRLRKLFVPRGRFYIPTLRKKLPQCEIRPVQDSDFDACEEIYRLNETAHFPAGYFPYFSDWLRNRRALVLVAVSDGNVRGFGGISAEKVGKHDIAALSFGMVHPAHQSIGFGTVLLFARLAVIPSPVDLCNVILTTSGGSETFFDRFGFVYFKTITDARGTPMRHLSVKIGSADQRQCMAAMGRTNIAATFLGAAVPPFSKLNMFSSDTPSVA